VRWRGARRVPPRGNPKAESLSRSLGLPGPCAHGRIRPFRRPEANSFIATSWWCTSAEPLRAFDGRLGRVSRTPVRQLVEIFVQRAAAEEVLHDQPAAERVPSSVAPTWRSIRRTPSSSCRAIILSRVRRGAAPSPQRSTCCRSGSSELIPPACRRPADRECRCRRRSRPRKRQIPETGIVQDRLCSEAVHNPLGRRGTGVRPAGRKGVVRHTSCPRLRRG
jgi:hypothetical protein